MGIDYQCITKYTVAIKCRRLAEAALELPRAGRELPGIAGNWREAVGKLEGVAGNCLRGCREQAEVAGTAWGAVLSITWSAYPSQKAFKRGSVLQVNVMKRERLGGREMSGGRCWESEMFGIGEGRRVRCSES